MSEVTKLFERLVEELRDEREKLNRFVETDLSEAKDDAKHLWARLEQQWSDLNVHHERIQQLAEDVADDVLDGVKNLADELREGYADLRALFKPKDD